MKIKKCLTLSLSLWLLSSCASKPPDVFVFEELQQFVYENPENGHLELKPSPTCMEKIQEPVCGHGVSIMKGREIWVGEMTLFNDKPWSELKEQMVMVPAIESYAPLVTYIIAQCQKNKCDKEVSKFKVKVDTLKGIGEIIKNGPEGPRIP